MSIDNPLFCRDYCPTSRKTHLILLNSMIFYVV